MSSHDCYPGSERACLDIVQEAADYLPTVQRRLDEADRQADELDAQVRKVLSGAP